MQSLDSPLSNDILLVFYFSCFHGEIISLGKIPSPDIIRRYFPNYDGQQKNVPNYDASNKIHRKTQFQGKKFFFMFFKRDRGEVSQTFLQSGSSSIIIHRFKRTVFSFIKMQTLKRRHLKVVEKTLSLILTPSYFLFLNSDVSVIFHP